MKKNKLIIGIISLVIGATTIVGCSSASSEKVEVSKSPQVSIGQVTDTNKIVEHTVKEVAKNDVEKVDLGKVKPSAEKKDTETKKIEKSKSSDTVIKSINADTSIHFINTGQSDCILIKGEKNVLIDGGNIANGPEVVSYLKNQGITDIDYLIATHNHADHIGGLSDVVDNIKVDHVYVSNGSADSEVYKNFINTLASKHLSPSVPLENNKFMLGNGAYIEFYNTNGGKDKNDQSLITLYVHGKDKALFMGDAQAQEEGEVECKLPDVGLLKVGHHGSKTSSTQAFLNKVNPEIAVICVGVDNKYHLPNKVVMDRLKNDDTTVYRTDENGNIVITSTGDGFKTSSKPADYSYRDLAHKKAIVNKLVKPKVQEKKVSIHTPTHSQKAKVNKTDIQMVWISNNGHKSHIYHLTNHCGRTNPSNAEEISKAEAIKEGYRLCKKED